ncbi:MAG: FGGY-family carbohydrate kinase [Christensenella sp.]|uniref:FGGY-family carbohydrate kinase n=1 Tax=Christensenella sp. TaxID=1935934 RepID=UPI002B21533F|nr:FGGY-family carbohydrate kinase [Christensenella sp.]MEA5004161.1 FGGY-family carbohydrate kinase [Christensenella sp.]
MEKNYFIGLDFGTQGVRCGLTDEDGVIVAISEQKYNTYHPAPGFAEQSPADWKARMDEAIKTCYQNAPAGTFDNVRGMAVCTTASTVIPVREDGQDLGDAILWMDVRAAQQAERINQTQHEILKYCGGEASVEWMVPKMMWLRENRPDLFEQADRIVELQDYINHVLTGNWCASVSQSTGKCNYVESMGGYNRDFFHEIGFDAFFEKANLDVIKQAQPVGTLRKELAQKYHLPDDVTVYQGGIDAHVNVVGLGVCRPGETGVVMGSSFVHLAVVARMMFEDGIWGPYQDVIIPGQYCLEGGQISAGSITKWFIREFDVQGDNPYMVMAEEADKIAIGCDGVVMLDYFQGNRTPYKDPLARGVFYGLTLGHTRAHLYRAILEGVAFGTRNILETMENEENSIHEIRGCGGVAFNPIWMQIIADATGKPIVLTEESGNAGVLGACIIAAVGAGRYQGFEQACKKMVHVTKVIEPNMGNYSKYTEVYGRYLELYQSLEHMMKK